MREVELHILRELSEGRKSFWELLDTNPYMLGEFLEALNNLYEKGLIAFDGEALYLSKEGKDEIDPNIPLFKSRICEKCQGRRILFSGKLLEVLKRFRRIVKGRPLPTVEYFQGYMREYDVVARVALMHHYGDLAGKDIVLIGDDDLLSIALALTGLPSHILVLDVDERLGSFIKQTNEKYGFNIEFQSYNVAEPLPKSLVGEFDVFSSEPLETVSGLKAFISRGVSCLKDGGVGYFGLTTIEASPRKWLLVQRMLSKMNCVVTDIIQGFSKYPTVYGNVNYEKFVARLKFPVRENPGIDWYKSALFRFKILGKPKPVVDWNKRIRLKYVDPEELTHPIFYKK